MSVEIFQPCLDELDLPVMDRMYIRRLCRTVGYTVLVVMMDSIW